MSVFKIYLSLDKEGAEIVKEKEKIIEMIQSLPEDSTVDDIMDELFFRIHVNRGLQELDEGKGIDHSEIKKRLSQWLTK